MKKITKKILLVFLLLGLSFLVWLYPRYSIPILSYHSIGYDKGLLSVNPESFVRQMRYLKDSNFKVMTLTELIEGLKSGKRLDRKTVVLTFDDGYKDNFTYAYPILKQFGFKATIFLISSFVAQNGYLNWDEVREMSKYGIEFGSHSKTHPYLPSVENNDEKLWDEIYDSKKEIENKLGISIKSFCYPIGGFSDKIKGYVKKAGYTAAVTTNRKNGLKNFIDFYAIRRISVRDDDGLSFRLKVLGYYNVFRDAELRIRNENFYGKTTYNDNAGINYPKRYTTTQNIK